MHCTRPDGPCVFVISYAHVLFRNENATTAVAAKCATQKTSTKYETCENQVKEKWLYLYIVFFSVMMVDFVSVCIKYRARKH